jgi:hypothetical protein
MPESQLDIEQSELAKRGLKPPRAFVPLHGKEQEIVQLNEGDEGDKQYADLAPGKKFKDPSGTLRVKPYEVGDDETYWTVPEGSQFLDPEGTLRTKPNYEGVGFTAQTLYDMGTNPRERRRALERSYPGKVKESGGQFYVEDDGVLRRPKSMGESWSSAASGIAAGAAPVAGAIGGEVGGAFFGNLPGAIAGAAGGGAAGQGFNDLVLGLAGIYDRSPAEEAGQLAVAGGVSAAGTAVGRIAAPWVGATAVGKEAGPRLAAHFLGADPEGLKTALELRTQKGVDLVPPGMWAKEAPHLVNVAQVYDPAFRQWNPLQTSATKHYERGVGDIYKEIGIEPKGSIVKPGATPSTREAGEALLARRLQAQQAADQLLKQKIAQLKSGSLPDGSQVMQAADASHREATRLIDLGFQNIERGVTDAMRVSKTGHNSGDLWAAVGDKLTKIRQGIAERAKVSYQNADAAAEGQLPDIGDLPETARDFLERLPEPFQSNYPTVVRKLRDLAGVPELDEAGATTGEWKQEPINPTFGQLHELRSFLRSNVNWYDLTPDIRDGVFKFFANKIDGILKNPGNTPELQLASKLLAQTDRWYREQIQPLNDKRIQAVISGLESGLPADPKVLFDTLIKEGRTDLTRKVADMIGPSLWGGVKAADVEQMLEASRSLVPNQYDGNAFAREVLSRHRSGMLEAVHGREASEPLIRQAQYIAMLDGKLDVAVRPGDRIADVIGKARDAAAAAKDAAARDPLAVLGRETKRIEAQHRLELARFRRSDPLGFVLDPTVGATEAVDRILGKEDLILAAAGRFGEDSREFNLLRQIYVRRVLEGTFNPSERFSGISPEVQSLMFPGVTIDMMKTLVKEMDLLSQRGVRDTAKSMAAQSHVERPWTELPLGHSRMTKIIGATAVGRSLLGKYFATVTELANSPALLRYIEKGLKGDERARAMSREALKRLSERGGHIGGAGAATAYQSSDFQNDTVP